MNRQYFFMELEHQLKKIPKEDLQDIIRDYEEYFQIGMKEGKTEAEIITNLGSPKQLAKEILANYQMDLLEKNPSTSNMFKATWAVIGLGLFNMIFVLGPFIGLLSLLLAGWIVSVSFVFSPVLALFSLTTNSFFQSILLCGIGLLLGIGLYYLTNWMKMIVIKYLKFNLSIVRGVDGND